MQKKRKCFLVFVVAISVLLTGIPWGSPQRVYAQESEFSDPDSAFSYDTSAFSKYVACRKHYTITANETITEKTGALWWKKTTTFITKGDVIGEVYIRSYWLYPKAKSSDGYYYSTVHFEAQINGSKPATDSNLRGLPYSIEIGFETPNPDSQIVLPKSAPINYVIEQNNTSTNSKTFEFGIGLAMSQKTGASVGGDGAVEVTVEKNPSATGSFGYKHNLTNTSSNTITFEYTGTSYTSRTNDYYNGKRYANWEYGYDYSKACSTNNLLGLSGTSYKTGSVTFRDSKRSTVTNVKMAIYYDFQYGAGYTKGNSRNTLLKNGTKDIIGTLSGCDQFSY